DLARNQHAADVGAQPDGSRRRRDHMPDGTGEVGDLFHRAREVAEQVGQGRDEEVAEWMPRELAIFEPVLDDGFAVGVGRQRRKLSAIASASTTDRCRPPVQPIAIVRYRFPSCRKPGTTPSSSVSRRFMKSVVSAWPIT